MLISKKWLQSYFTNELPSMRKIADTLLLHSFEIEGLEEVDGDWVLNIDVLPNRAHDCLCHAGVAKELSGLLDTPLKSGRYSLDEITRSNENEVSVAVMNLNQCTRYMATLVENIEVRESPKWLKFRLASMGQKSINALVDATNYVMFDIGQPMHVFDADKVVGGITVRNVMMGDTMTTLSGEELELLETDLVICDNEGILALAGVKGGTRAEVTADTKNIIIESAHFNPATTRATARRVKILTDASKRYENEITAEKVAESTTAMIALILEIAGTVDTSISESTDIYPNPETQYNLELTVEHTARLLGFDISESDINILLERFGYTYSVTDGVYIIHIPSERLDLRIAEDMIEEIGRLYGYHMIPVKSLDDINFKPQVNKDFYYAHVLRNYFVDQGFTEIMNYTFVNKGEVSVLNPLASDKKALRKDLSKQMKESLEKNARLIDFVNAEQVLNFEIDAVHTADGEKRVCCFGIDTVSKKSRKKYGNEEVQIERYMNELAVLLGIEKLLYVQDRNIISFELAQASELIPETYADILKRESYTATARFVGISPYPYMKRDISFWIDTLGVDILQNAINNAGAVHLQKVFLFDEFEKEGKTSYAFSMIFQSYERTLTDVDVDADMQLINNAVEEFGADIR